MRLKAGSLNLGGSIIADGLGGNCCWQWGGSGGGVRIEVAGAITGTGNVYARGGSVNSQSGGGGRIAIYYGTGTFDSTHAVASGRENTGQAGTVYIKNPGQQYGNLTFDNAGQTASTSNTRATLLTLPGSAGQQNFDNLFVLRWAQVYSPDVLNVLGTVHVDSNARLQSANYNLP